MKQVITHIVLFALLIAPSGAQNSAADDDVLWREFITWWRVQDRSVDDPRPGYCALKKLPAEECERWFESLKRVSRQHTEEANAVLFDKIYRNEKPTFKTTPTVLLTKVIDGLPPGKALDIHMGQGRNAVYLASKGWTVVGFDASPEAIRRARSEAAIARVAIDARESGHANFDFGSQQWDLIVLAYPWLPLDDDALVGRIINSLKPNGRLVFEHYIRSSCSNAEKGEHVPCPNQLLDRFRGLRVVYYEEKIDLPDWASKPQELVRFVGQRAPKPR